MPSGVGSWDTRICWGGMVRDEDLCVPLEWGQRGKGNYNRFSAMELGMILVQGGS